MNAPVKSGKRITAQVESGRVPDQPGNPEERWVPTRGLHNSVVSRHTLSRPLRLIPASTISSRQST